MAAPYYSSGYSLLDSTDLTDQDIAANGRLWSDVVNTNADGSVVKYGDFVVLECRKKNQHCVAGGLHKHNRFVDVRPHDYHSLQHYFWEIVHPDERDTRNRPSDGSPIEGSRDSGLYASFLLKIKPFNNWLSGPWARAKVALTMSPDSIDNNQSTSMWWVSANHRWQNDNDRGTIKYGDVMRLFRYGDTSGILRYTSRQVQVGDDSLGPYKEFKIHKAN